MDFDRLLSDPFAGPSNMYVLLEVPTYDVRMPVYLRLLKHLSKYVACAHLSVCLCVCLIYARPRTYVTEHSAEFDMDTVRIRGSHSRRSIVPNWVALFFSIALSFITGKRCSRGELVSQSGKKERKSAASAAI